MLADFLGNRYSLEQVQKVIVSDQWNSTCHGDKMFRCSYWSASLLETTYWFRLKRNFAKCGNYCESPLLPIIPNFDHIPPLYLASLKSLTYLVLIHFLSLPLCILITIIFCLVSSSFNDLFLSSNEVHQYETWLASQYRPHFCRTNITQFSILYRGPKIWNSLPVSLISSPSMFVFKKI